MTQDVVTCHDEDENKTDRLRDFFEILFVKITFLFHLHKKYDSSIFESYTVLFGIKTSLFDWNELINIVHCLSAWSNLFQI